MTLELIKSEFMPAMTMEDVINRRNTIVEFVKAAMQRDTDFGVIPGTGTKPTLLKPGAEKLLTLFGLTSRMFVADKVEDWTGKEHGDELFFFYRYACQLLRGERLIAESEGSCNSFEKKYRYRQQELTCPACGKSTIIKGREEYGGGWVCFSKKGGCNAKFVDNDERITKQPRGQVKNPDIADQVNTIQKMAQKRALIAATLLAVNASEFFTQDIEDMVIEGDYTMVENAHPKPPQPPVTQKAETPAPAPAAKSHASNGGKPAGKNQIKILTKRWADVALAIADEFPQYKDGDEPNYVHILNALWQESITEINEANAQTMPDVMRQHVTNKQPTPA